MLETIANGLNNMKSEHMELKIFSALIAFWAKAFH